MKHFKVVVSALIFIILLPGSLLYAQDTSPEEQAVAGMIQRLLPGHYSQISVEFIDRQPDGKDVFEIETVDEKLVLRGNNGVSVASALNYYLKNITHCSVTWNGTNLNLPEMLPAVEGRIVKTSPYRYRYYLNYCTFNYSMSWWDWERWQKEIDWMALNGINMPLAVTGQNSVWQRVYKSMGLTDSDLEGFFSGPAYFNWFWMGNLDGWGGPLPQSFIDGHEELQKKIVARERAFGMTPVLPAFTGHVPKALKERYPEIKVKHTTWVGFPEVSILDPDEPMFMEIGKRFIEEQAKTYGTDHLYSADTFNENEPPSDNRRYLNNMSSRVYRSMAAADSEAVWVMQGWLFYHDRKFWGDKEIKALLDAVPDDRMIILDLWSERYPVWNRTEAYYGKPWIWNMLHNFGQNINLSGNMSVVAAIPAQTLNNPEAGNISGIGLTMEGIGQNPVVYDLLLENVWRDTPIDLDTWLDEYALCRYGSKNDNAEMAWQLLRKSVYCDTLTNGGPESIVTARPTFKANPGGTSNTRLPYDPRQLVEAWSSMIKAAPELSASEGFQYDIADITRQVLADYASVIQQQMAADFSKRDTAAFRIHSSNFLALLSDMDDLLATRSEFLLGNWLETAKRWGTNEAESTLYERNARDLITLWGDRECRIHEYACKQWSGLINGFYKQRWMMFINQVKRDLAGGIAFDQDEFDREIKEWEWQWIGGKELYPAATTGNAVEVSCLLYYKYSEVIDRAYRR